MSTQSRPEAELPELVCKALGKIRAVAGSHGTSAQHGQAFAEGMRRAANILEDALSKSGSYTTKDELYGNGQQCAATRPAEVGGVLSACREWIARHAEEMGYGYWRPEKPHDFTPDRESCTEEEIAAHAEACAAWDRGDYKRDESGGWVTPDVHILTAPWGIGTYVMRDKEAGDLIAAIDSLTPPAPGSDGEAVSGHTPGPWTAHQYGVRDAGGYICALKWPSLYTGQDERYWRETAERQADARLIAAAPDLLEALRDIVSWIPNEAALERLGFLTEFPELARKKAVAAIAKATTTPESN